MLTGATPVANGGTGLTSGTTNQFLKFTGSTTLASADDNQGGITEADQWRITSNFSGDAVPIASNWERNDTDFDKLGTGLTESSGIFSFPSTGIYLVMAEWVGYYNGDSKYNEYSIQVTTNNSSYEDRGNTSQFLQATSSDNGDANCGTSCMIDVTDISNVKFRITLAVAHNSTTTKGNSGQNRTFITAIRLGDT
jgi:hypothetical protein